MDLLRAYHIAWLACDDELVASAEMARGSLRHSAAPTKLSPWILMRPDQDRDAQRREGGAIEPPEAVESRQSRESSPRLRSRGVFYNLRRDILAQTRRRHVVNAGRASCRMKSLSTLELRKGCSSCG